ncbi:MAG: type III polyketide synthase, partial [Bacteroidetes bacterium]|nr:type III polyketide synthase [Bacteroidota bacterium]
MSKVISVATEDAPTVVGQDEVKEFARKVFSGERANFDRLAGVFTNASIETRHFTEPKEWYGEDHGFAERNALYIENAVRMSAACARACLAAAGAGSKEFQQIIFVSSTGISTPSVDARLHNILGFDQHVRRTPLWGIGCAGGAVGLSRALEYTSAFPSHAVLVVAIELCGLTFQKDDYSKSNIIGTSLFSDGAAAVLVVGDEHPLARRKGLRLLNSLSTIYDDSLAVMGWDVKDSGLKVIFSKDIPTIVHESVRENIQELAEHNNVSLRQIEHFVVHPGGPKVIDAYEDD